MTVHYSRLAEGLTTVIPDDVRAALKAEPGDMLIYTVEDGEVRLRRVSEEDWGWKMLSNETFAKDWLSPEDCAAFDDL